MIFPEIEIAEELADRMTWTNVVDFLPIDPDYSFLEIAVPDSFSGSTLQDLNIRQKYGVWIVGVKDSHDRANSRCFPPVTSRCRPINCCWSWAIIKIWGCSAT